MNSAELCRRKDWVVGDTLEGYEAWSPGRMHGNRIVLTAIGEAHVLARCVAQRQPGGEWMACPCGESGWSLGFREWSKVAEAPR